MKPALRIVYPALSSQFILLVLTSSVVSVISAEELTAVADRIASRNFRTFEVYFVVDLHVSRVLDLLRGASLALQSLLFRSQERAMIREFTVERVRVPAAGRALDRCCSRSSP